jgi:hypothetical protein
MSETKIGGSGGVHIPSLPVLTPTNNGGGICVCDVEMYTLQGGV